MPCGPTTPPSTRSRRVKHSIPIAWTQSRIWRSIAIPTPRRGCHGVPRYASPVDEKNSGPLRSPRARQQADARHARRPARAGTSRDRRGLNFRTPHWHGSALPPPVRGSPGRFCAPLGEPQGRPFGVRAGLRQGVGCGSLRQAQDQVRRTPESSVYSCERRRHRASPARIVELARAGDCSSSLR
jgi:hypothetical protein